MNPITNAKNILKLNQRELDLGVTGKNKKSWHDEYKDSAWVFIGGLPYDLTEGDVVCVFSQYGEVVNVNLVRDKSTGKSKGFAFLCYEDQRSTVLAVDNLNTIKVLGRIIRVDHVADYKKPKEKGDEDEVTLMLRAEGCAPKVPQTSTTPPPLPPQSELPSLGGPPLTIRPLPGAVKPKKAKKDKKKKKKKKKKKMKVTVKVERRSDSDSSSSSGESSDDDNDDFDDDDDRPRRKRKSPVNLLHADELKREKEDRGYDRALHGHHHTTRESRDMKPEISHLEESRHRSGDRYRESTEGQREKVTVKREPSESQRHRDDKRSDRREEERRHRDRDEDRDRQDDRRRDDRRDYRRDRDDYDRRRR